MKITFDLYFERQHRDIPNELRAELDLETLRKNLSEDYDLISSRMSDITFGQRYQQACLISGSLAQDYLYRELYIDGVGYMITSIRFVGRDISKPFVHIEFLDFGWSVFFSEIGKVKEGISLSYQIFSPLSIRIFIPIAWVSAISHTAYIVDQYFLSRPLRQNISIESGSIDIKRIYDFSSADYELYSREYDIFHRVQPSLAHVKPLPYDQAAALCTDGMVYKIYSKGEWVGMCFLEESHEAFFYGYYIAGQITFDRYKGKGMASAAQSMIIAELASQGHGFMYGTIEAVNLPSISSAQKVGRKKTAAYVFIDL